MQKRAPTLGNLLVIVLFVLSCFGLLMFLWESFGGPLPLKPKGYRFSVAFPRSFSLAEESDVRISGVEVGHIVSVKLNKEGRTQATVEIAGKYAPVRANMHAILRTKTLLGETYIQLIPEAQSGPYLADGGRLPNTQVEPSVTLDDILSAFNPKTRRDFQIWQEATAAAIDGRGEQINASFAQLEPFVESANKLVTVLDAQEGAVKALVHNTGVVFNALASRDHQLEGSIVNGERTFHAAAEASTAFAAAFRALPGFESKSRTALKEVDRFQAIADPYFKEFQPTERQLSLLLEAAKPFAPEFNKFLTALGPADEGGQDQPARSEEVIRPDRPRARKLQAGAAQPRPVPAVHGRICARAAGVLREHRRCLTGERRRCQHRTRRAQGAFPDDDERAQPAEPRDLPEPGRHRARKRLPALRLLQIARQRPAGFQLELVRQLRAFGYRARQRNGVRRNHYAAAGVQSRQQARNRKRRAGALVRQAEPVHVQRRNERIPKGRIQGKMMTEDRR